MFSKNEYLCIPKETCFLLMPKSTIAFKIKYLLFGYLFLFQNFKISKMQYL